MGGVARHPNRSNKSVHWVHGGLFTSPRVKAPIYCSVDQNLCCVIFTLSSNLNLRLVFFYFLKLIAEIYCQEQPVNQSGRLAIICYTTTCYIIFFSVHIMSRECDLVSRSSAL